MSLESWKEEFYQVPASRCTSMTNEELVAHSLNKWKGLLPENLRRHKVVRNHDVLVDPKAELKMHIGGSSCALCRVYYRNDDYRYCIDCPLAIWLSQSCDEVGGTEYSHGLYEESLDNPMLMVDELSRLLKHLQDTK